MELDRETGIQNGNGKRDCVTGSKKGIGKGSGLWYRSRRDRTLDRGMCM